MSKAEITALPKWAADRVKTVPIHTLRDNPYNARLHTEDQVDQVVASIEAFGWTVPIIADEQNVLIAGHARLMAARKIGLKKVPVMIVTGWTDEQKRAYAIADNKLPLNATWDPRLLQVELAELAAAGVDLTPTGFSQADIEAALAAVTNFTPASEPVIRDRTIDDGDIEAAKENVQTGFETGAQVLIPVICPYCAKEFDIDKLDPEYAPVRRDIQR